MKKVGFIIDTFSFNGGTERFLSNLSMSLPKEYKQYIIVIYNRGNFSKNRKVRKWEHNAEIIDLNFKEENRVKTFFLNKTRSDSLLQVKKELDLDFCVSVGYYSNELNVRSNSIGKTILSVHSFQKKMRNKFKYYKYSEADKVITVSNGVSDLLSSYYGIDKKKIKTIYNVFDINKIAETTTKEQLLDTSVFNILMVGRFVPVKGHWHAIDIVSKIVTGGQKNVKLNIIGGGNLEGELKKLADKKHLSEKIDFLGFKEDVYEYMSQADILLMTSLFEGLSMVIIEALASSLPVISANCESGPREILSDSQSLEINELKTVKCGALYPRYTANTDLNNINEEDSQKNQMVADYIIELIKNNNELTSFKKHCYSRAMDFDAKNIIQEWIDILQ